MKLFLFAVLVLATSLSPGSAGTLVQFRTVLGNVEVELYDQDKPGTVQNFIRYVQSGRYQDVFAHRLIPNFVIQGGGYGMTNRGTTNVTIVAVPTYPPIPNESGVGRQFSNVYGTIAMAKLSGDTNSATGQWYFNLTNNTFLDAHDTNNYFTVFSRVVGGTNVLNAFNKFQNWTGTQSSNLVYNWGSPFENLPLLYPNLNESSFVFVDITLLRVAVKTLAGGAMEISWNSVLNRTNLVQYTTNFPPAWQVLAATNGTRAAIKVTDSATNALARFYRVRVVY